MFRVNHLFKEFCGGTLGEKEKYQAESRYRELKRQNDQRISNITEI